MTPDSLLSRFAREGDGASMAGKLWKGPEGVNQGNSGIWPLTFCERYASTASGLAAALIFFVPGLVGGGI